jgi:hypothetical protein
MLNRKITHLKTIILLKTFICFLLVVFFYVANLFVEKKLNATNSILLESEKSLVDMSYRLDVLYKDQKKIQEMDLIFFDLRTDQSLKVCAEKYQILTSIDELSKKNQDLVMPITYTVSQDISHLNYNSFNNYNIANIKTDIDLSTSELKGADSFIKNILSKMPNKTNIRSLIISYNDYASPDSLTKVVKLSGIEYFRVKVKLDYNIILFE